MEGAGIENRKLSSQCVAIGYNSGKTPGSQNKHGEEEIRIISARKATPRERAAYSSHY